MFLTSISFVDSKPFLFEKYQNVWPFKSQQTRSYFFPSPLFSLSLSLSLSSRRGGSRLIINQTCWYDTRGKARLSPALRPRGRESQRGVVTRLGRVFRGKENASRPINSGRESGRAESPHDSLSLSLSRRYLSFSRRLSLPNHSSLHLRLYSFSKLEERIHRSKTSRFKPSSVRSVPTSLKVGNDA